MGSKQLSNLVPPFSECGPCPGTLQSGPPPAKLSSQETPWGRRDMPTWSLCPLLQTTLWVPRTLGLPAQMARTWMGLFHRDLKIHP